MPNTEVEYLTVKAACELLGISPNTLRSWGGTGKVTEYRHPVNNYRLFQRDELEKLRKRLQHPTPKPVFRRKSG
jgi:DNA-binding transcriptional MerR regulator